MFILIWTPITNPAFLEVFSIWYYSSLSLGIQIRSRFPNDVIFGGTVTSDPPSYIPGHVWATTHRTASSSSELSEGLLKNMAIIRTGIKTNWGRTEFWLGPCFFFFAASNSAIENKHGKTRGNWALNFPVSARRKWKQNLIRPFWNNGTDKKNKRIWEPSSFCTRPVST